MDVTVKRNIMSTENTIEHKIDKADLDGKQEYTITVYAENRIG